MITACCDIGNTKIKIGLFDNDHLAEFISFNTLKDVIKFLRPIKLDDIVVSSVVPKKSQTLIDFCRYERVIDIFEIDNKTKFNLTIDYKTPETLGVDRVCSSEGAYKLYTESTPLMENEIILAADLGTATTLNVISFPGVFKGGIIAPGPGLLFKAMNLYTAQLPEASHNDYDGVIGRDTKSCLASGIMNSISGLVNRIYDLLSESNQIAAVYVTGGNANLFLPDFSFEFIYKPELLVIGMKSIFDFNRSQEH